MYCYNNSLGSLISKSIGPDFSLVISFIAFCTIFQRLFNLPQWKRKLSLDGRKSQPWKRTTTYPSSLERTKPKFPLCGGGDCSKNWRPGLLP